MTTQHNSGYSTYGRSRGRFAPFLLGVLFALLALVVGGWAYLKYGHPPVAAADPAFPMEAQIVHVPLAARIGREVEKAPFGTSEEVFEQGAKVYASDCAFCHGTPGHDSAYGKWMYPAAPQLWRKHKTGSVVGVSDDEAGESYWKVKNGIRLTGMPAYGHILSDAQMWDVSLLVKNADQPLPDPVANLLQGKGPAAAPESPAGR